MFTQDDNNLVPPQPEQEEGQNNPSTAPNYDERINALDEQIKALVEQNNVLQSRIDSLKKEEDKHNEPKLKIKTYY